MASLEFDGGVRVLAREKLAFDDDDFSMGSAERSTYDLAADGRILTIGQSMSATGPEDTEGSTDPVLVTDIFQELAARVAAERR